jgi:SAM-dependent methyltransferase
MGKPWMIDELAHAGPEHLDLAFVAGYDQKQGYPDPVEDLSVFASHGLTRTSTVVDLGAGTGQFALAAARRFGHVTAVDVSPVMLKLLRDRAAGAGHPTHQWDERNGGDEDRDRGQGAECDVREAERDEGGAVIEAADRGERKGGRCQQDRLDHARVSTACTIDHVTGERLVIDRRLGRAALGSAHARAGPLSTCRTPPAAWMRPHDLCTSSQLC